MEWSDPVRGDEREGTTPGAGAGLPDQSVFVGREVELRRLADALRPGPGPAVTTISGMGGVGKTALAVRAAAAADDAGWFPGGALMADVQAYEQSDDGTVASSVLAGLLHSVGIAADQMPAGLEDRARLWRSVLARHAQRGTSMLIVVDNVSSAEQVRPILPGAVSHGQHRVLITSRYSLSALQGVRRIVLGVLSLEEAVKFLIADLEAADAGHGRVQTSPEAAMSLVGLCGCLPLALRISAGLLADDPHRSVDELVSALRSETDRLEELNLDGTVAVRAAFDVSYRNLAGELARVFRLLPVIPGSVVGAEAVAALTGLPRRAAGRALRELAQAHLIDSTGAGRWRMHDLVRLYAAERRQPGEIGTAGEALIGYYLHMAHAAEGHLDPFSRAADGGPFADRRAALTWLDAERAGLVGAVALANDIDAHAQAVQLAAALHCFLELRRHWQDGVATATEARNAARQLRDRQAEWIALANLGHAYRDGRQHEKAYECHQQSLRVCCEVGDRCGEAFNLSALGNACMALNRQEEAVAHNTEALKIHRELGDRYGQRITLNHLGNALRLAGHLADAIDCYQESIRIRDEMGDSLGEGRTLTNLGIAYRDQGRRDEAIDCFQRDLNIARELQDRPAEAYTLTNLGDAHRDAGRYDDARTCFHRALTIGEELMDRVAVRDLKVRLGRLEDGIPMPPPHDGTTFGYDIPANCASPRYDLLT
ncbi:tetratricopeptide repeat protein [Amycolatopsis sp. NPDC051061]|uniref:tetratricopeptide repeat protein n=1 Tax=Amycolatopsis sp. NPDC051061 TaxID=3155042 RepID=UPI0034235DD3